MNRKIISFLTALTLFSTILPPIHSSASDTESGLVLAFPGAEGAGKYATGGRGGTIYHVTNLNDSGAGSFRDAVSGYNRIIVFDVGGTINLKSDVVCKGNITIAGQTAPGGNGITLRGGKIGMGGDNIIVRFISSRPGEKGTESDYDAWGGSAGSNSIIDHCSLGWANDEQFGLYSKNMNQTVQYTIIGPSNCVSYHSKGAHGFGAMFGKGQNTWHHNLLCHSLSRNFRGKVEKTEAMDFVNNVIYDWGYQTAYGTMGHINYVNNYLKGGPSTKGGYRFLNNSSGSGKENYKFYVEGNTMRKKDGSYYNRDVENNNNWLGVSGFAESTYRSYTPFTVSAVDGSNASVVATAESAEDAFEHVVSYAGAAINAESRTKIDAQVLEETKNGTGSLTGGRDFSTVTDSAVKKAISKYGIKYMDYDSYYPAAITKKTITDSDNDGMPDDWEIERGLNPNDASDALDDYFGDGYNNIEYYINDLTVDAFPKGVVTKSKTTEELGPDFELAKADAKALTLDKTKITYATDLTLPVTAPVNGSTVSWNSSSSAIRIENNVITSVHNTAETQIAALVASVTHTSDSGSYTFKRTFNITVRPTSWVPASGNNGAAAETKLMDGLYNVSALKVTSISDGVTINNQSFSSYASGDDNGAWSNGAATGTAFRFKAAANGYLSAYITALAANKTAYIVPAGAASQNDCAASVSGADGTEQVMLAPVEKGKTYYIFVAGSKGRFTKISFTTEPQQIVWIPTESITTEKCFAPGLSASEGMAYSATTRDIDGIVFNGRVQGSTNPGGSPKGETGAAFKYSAPAKGNLTVYYKIGTTKTFKITDSTGKNLIASYTNEAEYDESDPTTNIGEPQYMSTTAEVYAGQTYYIYVDGSKGEFYGISFEQTGTSEIIPTPPPKPTPTPTPTPKPTPAVWRAASDVTEKETLMSGLTADGAMTYTAQTKTIDSVDFTGYVTPSTNTDGLTFTAPAYGTFTAYMEVGAGKTFSITDGDGNVLASTKPDAKVQTSLTADVKKGVTYKANVAGSSQRIYGAIFKYADIEPTAEPTTAPTNKPVSCVKLTAMYKDGILQSVAIENATVTEFEQSNDGNTKIFYWDNLESMKPIKFD